MDGRMGLINQSKKNTARLTGSIRFLHYTLKRLDCRNKEALLYCIASLEGKWWGGGGGRVGEWCSLTGRLYLHRIMPHLKGKRTSVQIESIELH